MPGNQKWSCYRSYLQTSHSDLCACGWKILQTNDICNQHNCGGSVCCVTLTWASQAQNLTKSSYKKKWTKRSEMLYDIHVAYYKDPNTASSPFQLKLYIDL